MARVPLALGALALVLAACGGSDDAAVDTREPAATRSAIDRPGTTASAAPSPTATPSPTVTASASTTAWEVGARVLPLRPDGFGVVGPTPKALRVRALPTIDELPPPPGGRWASSIRPIDAALRDRIGTTWQPGCPVPLADLRYLTVTFRGFDGAAHTGELIVHRKSASDIVDVFRTLFRADFPIESMRLVQPADLTAPPTGDGNNTAAFVCRPSRKQTQFSAHAYGLALDLNPFQNPYRRDDLVLPELASSYLDRSWRRPGMLRSGDVAVRAFEAIGWTWGGRWKRTVDTMHFSALGR